MPGSHSARMIEIVQARMTERAAQIPSWPGRFQENKETHEAEPMQKKVQLTQSSQMFSNRSLKITKERLNHKIFDLWPIAKLNLTLKTNIKTASHALSFSQPPLTRMSQPSGSLLVRSNHRSRLQLDWFLILTSNKSNKNTFQATLKRLSTPSTT